MAAGEVENFLGHGETSFYDSKKILELCGRRRVSLSFATVGPFGYFEFPRNHGLGKSRDF